MNKIIKEDLEIIFNQNLDWTRFENKNILITGANGILASYMVMTLLYLNKTINNKCKIYALVRNVEKAKNKFKDYLNDENLIFIEQDVCDPIQISENIHFVIHAASQASPKYYLTDPVGTLNANIIGTNNILKFSKEKKVESVLFFSTSEVYGEILNDTNSIKETDYGYIDCLKIRSCYSESKRMGETMCVSWLKQYNVPSKIVRIFHTYGPGIELNDGRVFSDFIKNIINNENIQMKSDGKAMRAFCYITDATLGFFKILLDGKSGEAYNLGNPNQEVSIYELAKRLIKIYPEKNLKVLKISQDNLNYSKSLVQKNTPCIDKLISLGWSTNISIEEGFKRTIESYLESRKI
ncbi:MAG: NAD-dependent epimerase/dehydratase family protein [Fusobacteriaceae bacterium]